MRTKPNKQELQPQEENDLRVENQRLRAEVAFYLKIEGLSRGTHRPRERERAKAIEELRPEHTPPTLLEVTGMARSTFYYHLKQLKFPDKYKQEKNEIVSIYHDHKGRYGYRRITVEMHNRGYSINHKTVLRLMTNVEFKCQVRLKKYRSYKGEVGAVVPDLLKRNFMAERPNQKWVTDLTEFSLFGKKFYLSPIMDLYNREIIVGNIAEHPTFTKQ